MHFELCPVLGPLSQEGMADVLGVSRKSLVQTEKGRRELSWTEAVCLATLFKDSPTLRKRLNVDPIEVISGTGYFPKNRERIVSPESYWRDDVQLDDGFAIQQNIIGKECRLVGSENNQLFRSLDYDEIGAVLNSEKDKGKTS